MIIGITELRNKFSYYLRRVKEGEEVVVTERGKPFVLIRPIRSINNRRQRFLKKVNAAYASLRKDKKAWVKFKQDRGD